MNLASDDIDVSRLAAVVFDLDGVLLDTTENMRHAFAASWRSAKRTDEPPFDEFLTHMGAPLPVILRLMGLPATVAEVYAQESARQLHLIKPYPGIAELLSALAARAVPTAVATGKSYVRAMQALQATGLAADLNVVIGSDLVTHPKPAPDTLWMALEELQTADRPQIRPDETVFVGDSVLDMRCGRAAGMIVAAAGWGQTAPGTLLAEAPDCYAAQPQDLIRTLNLAVSTPQGRVPNGTVRVG